MTWINRYQPPTQLPWQGRDDLPPNACLFQTIQLLNLTQTFSLELTTTAFAFVGFCCDEGIRRNVGRVGANEGPNAIRDMLAKLPLHRHDILIFDAGNITCHDGDLESSQAALAECIQLLLQQQITPIVLGGGHELAWGHYQGIAKTLPTSQLGILNFDAHFDMRPLVDDIKGSSGTPFLQIAEAEEKKQLRFDYNCIGIQMAANIALLFATAEKYHVNYISAEQIHQHETDICNDLIDRIITENDAVYLSICLDVFAAAYAPGVSAPQPLGLIPSQVIPHIQRLAASGKMLSYDLAELSPKFDIDHRTARLAASLIFEILHHHQHYFRNGYGK